MIITSIPISAQKTQTESQRLTKLSKNVTIVRDQWGIAHISGKTDADAVFGMLYAQCEDDFPRIEMNYIEKLGRLSEIRGKSSLFVDLENRMLLKESDGFKTRILAKITSLTLIQYMNKFIFDRPINNIKIQIT